MVTSLYTLFWIYIKVESFKVYEILIVKTYILQRSKEMHDVVNFFVRVSNPLKPLEYRYTYLDTSYFIRVIPIKPYSEKGLIGTQVIHRECCQEVFTPFWETILILLVTKGLVDPPKRDPEAQREGLDYKFVRIKY